MDNKQKSLRTVLCAFLLVGLLAPAASAYDSVAPAGTYLYDSDGNDVASPDAYLHARSVRIEGAGEPQDLFCAADGRLIVADTGRDRVLILSADGEPEGEISALTMPDGSTSALQKPEGVTVDREGRILIADTGNGRIVRCTADGKVTQQILRPDGMTGVDESASFLPSKLAEDTAGRLYIVVRNVNLGIVQLSADGRFIGYMGAPRVQFSLAERFWRRLSTREQLAKMQQFVPTEYNNITMDGEGFLYGTIGSIGAAALRSVVESRDTSGKTAPIKKLNTMGSDVLKRNGTFAPIGDLLFDDDPSRIVDIALGPSGTYTLLDSTRGHLFTYDENGVLLFAFGGLGTRTDELRRPVSAVYAGDTLIVLDATLGELAFFTPTEHGRRLLSAVDAQYNGDYDKAYAAWSVIAEEDRELAYAFVGLGNARLQEKRYAEAMECFRYADDKEGYSRAKGLLRRQRMETVFPVLFAVLAAALVLSLTVPPIRRVVRYCRGEGEEDLP